MKQNEALILGIVGLATVGLIVCGIGIVWSRPQFLYMPIYNNNEKDRDTLSDDDWDGTVSDDDWETEMVQGCR